MHDNAALIQATRESDRVIPFFILDPFFDRTHVGVNRYQFLLQSLGDLDDHLRTLHGSRLLVLQGHPERVLQDIFEGKAPFSITDLFWEIDSEPYARRRDAQVREIARKFGVRTKSFTGHTLLDLEATVAAPGFKAPISMRDIQSLIQKQGPIPEPHPEVRVPPLHVQGFEVPHISEFYDEPPTSSGFPGGEREALRRLSVVCHDTQYVCQFEKPKTASTGQPRKPWEPSTTGLSPYFKFGCLSVRTAWHAFAKCYEGRRHSQPPQSLHGQLLFREMFYVLASSVPNFDQAVDNPMCKIIPWDDDPTLFHAWAVGKTGYPFIDALMRQLRTTGFIHHLGRHAVACFLTRGDLWQHWTRGRDVFDELLLDADWAVNNGNWLWLAGVAPFSAPYFRVYDPCPGPRSSLNAEQTGEFVRHFVPELRGMPDQYIYRPWEAPTEVQRKAGCIVGVDYPAPVVDHKAAREANLKRFKDALDALAVGALPEKFRTSRDPGRMASNLRDVLPSSRWKTTDMGSSGLTGLGGGKRPEASRSLEVLHSKHQIKQRRWAVVSEQGAGA